MISDRASIASEAAGLIRRFLSGDVGVYEWDDQMGIKWRDAELERLRIECWRILGRLEGASERDRVEAYALLHEIADRFDAIVKTARP